MKYTMAIGALAATAAAVAAPDFPARMDKRQGSSFNTGSALGVLETALPPSLLSLAITNSGAASSQIASEFAAGQTPSWFSGLPSDIQTYLVPAVPTPSAAGASVLSSAASSLSSAAGITPRPSQGMSMPYGTNGTAANSGVAGLGSGSAGGMTPTPGSGSTPSGSGSGSSSTGGSGSGSGSSGSGGSSRAGGAGGSSTGGVPAQTAALGMGIAGFAAVAGVLAL